jgi:hypothetical protein
MEKKMKVDQPTWMKVSPHMAEEWLNANTINRKLRPGVVEKYTRDMKAGKWTRNPQPIIFYNTTDLADGQHRLWAVIESGKTIEFLVVHGIEREVGLNIDTGLGRDLVDNARISQYEGYITKQSIGTAVMMHHGRRLAEKTLSNAERLALVERYSDHLSFADRVMTNKKGIGQMAVRAAVARAHMYEGDNARLVEFCTIIGTGIPNDAVADRAALALRNYLLDISADRKLDPRDTFLKAMNAISYFMKRKPLTAIKVLKDEAYPLKKKK